MDLRLLVMKILHYQYANNSNDHFGFLDVRRRGDKQHCMMILRYCASPQKMNNLFKPFQSNG